MPIHDWRRVSAGTFHDFHSAWIIHLKETLNAGFLPGGYYALAEQHAGDIVPDVLTLQATDSPQLSFGDDSGAIAVAVNPAHAAGVQMKIAVFVQVGSSDSADDADDGKVVADDDDGG